MMSLIGQWILLSANALVKEEEGAPVDAAVAGAVLDPDCLCRHHRRESAKVGAPGCVNATGMLGQKC